MTRNRQWVWAGLAVIVGWSAGAWVLAGEETPPAPEEPGAASPSATADLPPIDPELLNEGAAPAETASPSAPPAYDGTDNDYSDAIKLTNGCQISGKLIAVSLARRGKPETTYPRSSIAAISMGGGPDRVKLLEGGEMEGSLGNIRFGSPAGVPKSVVFDRREVVAVQIGGGKTPPPEVLGKSLEDRPGLKGALAKNRELEVQYIAQVRDAQKKEMGQIDAKYNSLFSEASKKTAGDKKVETAHQAALKAKQRLDNAVRREANFNQGRPDTPVRVTRNNVLYITPSDAQALQRWNNREEEVRRERATAQREFRLAVLALEAAMGRSVTGQTAKEQRLDSDKTKEIYASGRSAGNQIADLHEVFDKHTFVLFCGGQLTEEQMQADYEAVVKLAPVTGPPKAQPPKRTEPPAAILY